MTDIGVWSPHLRKRLATLGLSATREREIVEELSQHLDARVDELLAGGVSREDAVRLTLAELARGDRLAERLAPLRQCRQPPPLPPATGAVSWRGFGLDVRHAARRLRTDWSFTAVAVLTLALGIGANIAIFSAVNVILLRPLPFADSARIVNVWLSRAHRANWHFHVPPADFGVIQASNRVFDRVALYDSDALNLTGGGDPEELSASFVSADLFLVLGSRPALGRLFDRTDEEPGRGDVAILSNGFWRRRYGADPAALGTIVRLNDRPFRVVGVLPAGFDFPGRTDVWLPRDRSDTQSNAYILGKLRPGATVAQAQADMDAIVATITNGRANPGMRFTVEPLLQTVTSGATTPWLLLLAAVGCVLAIGCVNISHLILARGMRRRREIDIRLALGATRTQIVRLLAAETSLLALAGGILALAVGSLGIRALRAFAPPDTPRLESLVVDPTLLLIAMAITLLTAFGFGLVPALQLSRANLKGAGAAATPTVNQSRARHTLVALEIALALVLLVGSSLLVRSLVRLTTVDPGFATDRLLTVNLHLPPGKNAQAEDRLDFITRSVAGLRSLPDVESASAASGSVMKGWGLPGAQRTAAQRITIEGATPDAARAEANMRRVEPAYFHTIGMRLVTGRSFTDADRASSLPVAIVNQSMARTYWPSGSAVGRRVAFEHSGGQPHWLEIVGIVNDVRDVALTEPPQPGFFIPLLQDSNGLGLDSLSLYVRTSRDPLSVADAVRAEIWNVDARQPVADVSTMELAVERFVVAPRFRTMLLAAVAALGLLLAIVGVHAVMSYSVSQRAPEMALRLALGAEPRQIVGLVLRQGLALASAGILVGVAGSLVFTRLMSGVLFGVTPVDPPTLAGASALVLVVVLAACYPPANRASTVDAAEVLRHYSA